MRDRLVGLIDIENADRDVPGHNGHLDRERPIGALLFAIAEIDHQALERSGAGRFGNGNDRETGNICVVLGIGDAGSGNFTVRSGLRKNYAANFRGRR